MRPGVRCTDCGRFGHEEGEPECPRYQERNPRGSNDPIEEGPLAQEDRVADEEEDAASNVDMDRPKSSVEEGVSAESAADVLVEGTDEEMLETDRQLAEDRRRKLQERLIEEYDIPDTLKRMRYAEQPNGASKVVG